MRAVEESIIFVLQQVILSGQKLMRYKRSRLNLGKISIKDSVAVNPLGSWAAAI